MIQIIYLFYSGKPTAYSSKNKDNWFEWWPCSYKCADGTRFPTNPTLDHVKCVDVSVEGCITSSDVDFLGMFSQMCMATDVYGTVDASRPKFKFMKCQ